MCYLRDGLESGTTRKRRVWIKPGSRERRFGDQIGSYEQCSKAAGESALPEIHSGRTVRHCDICNCDI